MKQPRMRWVGYGSLVVVVMVAAADPEHLRSISGVVGYGRIIVAVVVAARGSPQPENERSILVGGWIGCGDCGSQGELSALKTSVSVVMVDRLWWLWWPGEAHNPQKRVRMLNFWGSS